MISKLIALITLAVFLYGHVDFLVVMLGKSTVQTEADHHAASGDDATCLCHDCDDFDLIGCHCGAKSHGAFIDKENGIDLAQNTSSGCAITCDSPSQKNSVAIITPFAGKSFLHSYFLLLALQTYENEWHKKQYHLPEMMYVLSLDHPPETLA